MSVELILIILSVFIISALIKGWSGFGTNLIAMPVLLMFSEYSAFKTAVVIVITVNVFLNISILVENKKFKLSSLKNIIVLVVLGIVFTFVGQLFLKSTNTNVLKIILGAFIILTVLNKSIKYSFKIKNKERYFIPVGIIAGLLNGIAGLGGLPVLILLSNSDMKKDEFRTTLVSFFLVMNIVAVVGFVVNGLYTTFIFTNIGIVIIPSILACLAGVYLSRRVSDKYFQRIMMVILFVFGSNLLYQGISSLL